MFQQLSTLSTPTFAPTLAPTAAPESDVLVISSEVFGLLVVLGIGLICAFFCCCRKNEAKRKILDLLAEAQLDVDAADLVNDESDEEVYEEVYEEDEDDATAGVTKSSVKSSYA